MTFIIGCSFGTECVNHGEIRKHDCTEYECIVTYKGDIQYGMMKPYRAGKYNMSVLLHTMVISSMV